MRISDWSSDVCSSDLLDDLRDLGIGAGNRRERFACGVRLSDRTQRGLDGGNGGQETPWFDSKNQESKLKSSGRGTQTRCCRERKSVVEGKSGSVRLDLGGRRIIQQKKQKHDTK